MKTLNLIAALFTAALLTLSINSNSFSNETGPANAVTLNAQLTIAAILRDTAHRKGAQTAVRIIAQALNVKNAVLRETA